MKSVRRATEADIPALLEMGARFHRASGYDFIPFDAGSVERTFRNLIEAPSGALFVVEGGMAAALAYPAYFNAGHIQAQELFWWVDEEARSSGAGRALLEALEGWAREVGAHSLTMISLAALDGERVAKLYERAGYRRSEMTFIKRL